MTIPTTSLPSDDCARHPLLSVLLTTALTLVALLGIGVWLLHGSSPDRPVAVPAVEQRTAVASQQVVSGVETGGIAKLQDGPSQGQQPLPPYLIYLAERAEQQRAMTELGLAAGEVVLVAGTPEEQAAASAHIEQLEMNTREAPIARAVRIVDLRPPYGSLRPRNPEGAQTVYLVGSAAEAEHFRWSIAEAEAIRVALGAPRLTVAILVIGDREEEHILYGLGDAAATRGSLGLPGLVVVDLRTPA